mgnify:CR=1 FL=1
MKSIYIANVDLEENEGIYKKIYAQAKGIYNITGNCIFITKNNKGSKILNLQSNDKKYNKNSPLKYLLNYIRSKNDINKVYIRHMIPNVNLIRLLKMCKRKRIDVYYEIPTYPYFMEQIRTSKKKYRAIVKVILDMIVLPLIYYYVKKMVVIKSNTKIKLYRKMHEITNGVEYEAIKTKELKEKNVFSLVTVGTLYPYHGYDRVLKGLKECNEEVDGKKVEFNIIGNSQTIEDLKIMVKELNLKNVKFLGVKNLTEMNELFDYYDVGLGCMALHRRNANIDTTIKVIEYYTRGIVVATSGISPMDKYNPKYTIHVEDNELPIDINKLYKEYINLLPINPNEISICAKEKFSWESIMKDILGGGVK